MNVGDLLASTTSITRRRILSVQVDQIDVLDWEIWNLSVFERSMNTGQIRLGLASVSVKMDPLSWQGHIVENTLGGTDSQTNKPSIKQRNGAAVQLTAIDGNE